MDFDLTDEQRLLQQSVTRFVADNCPLNPTLRELTEAGSCADASLWSAAVELGLTAILVPGAQGGLGMTLLDAALVQEVLGGGVVPLPMLAQNMAAVGLKIAGGAEEELSALAGGGLRYAVGLSEQVERRDGSGVQSNGDRLNGTALFVIDSERPDRLLVADQQGALYEVMADRVQWQPLISIDATRALAGVELNGAEARRLMDGPDAVRAMIDAGRVLLAADSLGAAQTMVDRAVAYAADREQFDRPIASFQAVKHLCAEMASELEPTRSMVWYAAYIFDVPANETAASEPHEMACHVKAHMAEVGKFVARTATEVHGGMGFTDLLGLHFWFKRIGLNRQLLGGPERVREEAARSQGWVA